ncbi:hypothetical protein SGQ44_18305 [Flavobacterium sp. Fl-77]|uniref:Uncharacterized protein n=1 Tax=Flavobacterium flavipigmentatum TaxID=2893884 RepID=A0AAJ2VYZ3_9FLAO|nr:MULTISPECIES: hypothetical protein [unclassified Flavobacterium]MDX6181925.1 hypothetical protein [Flavobacterium sp. Fl-33]MDX6187708.1 hypothetical protein [Flavobacterium sp. Fl-77]
MTIHEICIFLRQDILLSHYITNFIIEKNLERLIQDNYIKELTEDLHIEDFGTHPIKYYSLTTHGYTFIKESGYVNTYYSKLSLEKENRLLHQSQIELTKSTISTNHKIVWMTGVIAVGTLVSAIYYGFEIYFFFHPCEK